jgi:hypothetical protein
VLRPADAVRAADAIGYPVVLKTAVAGIAHKSDVGGVLSTFATPPLEWRTTISLRLGPQVLVQAWWGRAERHSVPSTIPTSAYAMVAAGISSS